MVRHFGPDEESTLCPLPPTSREVAKAAHVRFPELEVVAGTSGSPQRPMDCPVLRIGRDSWTSRVWHRPSKQSTTYGLVRSHGRLLPFSLILPLPWPGPRVTPANFRVAAVLAVRNEADILGWVLDEMMNREEVDVYVIDNHSTDPTPDVLRARVDHPRFLGWESWPDVPDSAFDWAGLLERKAEIAAGLPTNWVIHSDGDEVRRSPWPNASLRDAVWIAELSGATMIDFTVVNHLPVQGYTPPDRTDVDRLDHVELGLRPGYFGQKKCWRVPEDGSLVRLSRGGHLPVHPDPRIFGLNFRVDHYPVRSQAHGERKILKEFRSRTAQERESRGWHRHYDHVTERHRFERPQGALARDTPDFRQAQAGRLILRAGMVPDRNFSIV